MPMSRAGMRRLAAHACAWGESASSIQISGCCPAYLMTGGSLSLGWKGTGGKSITGQSGIWEQGGEEPVGVGAPCGSPHDLEPGSEFLQPWPVRRAQPYWFFAGEELVFGVAGRAGRCCERVQDSVHVEQEQREAGGHCPLIVPSASRAGKSPVGRRWAWHPVTANSSSPRCAVMVGYPPRTAR